MSFLSNVFGNKAEKAAAKPGVQDFIAALSMHLGGEVEAALAGYRKIAAQIADDVLANFFAASIEAEQGDAAGAAEVLRALSRRISEMGVTISHAVSLELSAHIGEDPEIGVHDVSDLVETFGDTLKEQGFVQEAAVCFEISASLVPDLADLLYKLGDTLHDLRMYDYAEVVLRQAIECAPNHWGSLYTFAVLLQDLGRDEEAIVHYEKAVSLDPDHAKCRNNYGAALFRTNRLDEALIQCTAAEKLDPAAPLVKINLGNIHFLKGDLEAARASFSEAIALNAAAPVAYYGLAMVEEALQSDSAKIRELYLTTLEMAPGFAQAHHALGNFLAKNGDADALTHFAAAAELNSGLTDLHKDFGKACLRLGRREEALEHLERALQQNPEDAMVREMLSSIGAVKH